MMFTCRKHFAIIHRGTRIYRREFFIFQFPSLPHIKFIKSTLDNVNYLCYLYVMAQNSFIKRRDLGAQFKRPLVPNPFTSIRENLGLTADQVARDLNMHRNSVLRTEQGQYDAPPEDLLEYYGLAGTMREGTLRAYNSWRVLMRQANYGLLFDTNLTAQTSLEGTAPQHPFKTWRLSSGVKALNTIAKAFALHQGILFRYESQSERCSVTPPVIIEALRDSGYSDYRVEELESMFQLFKQRTRESLTVVHSIPVGKAS